MGTRLAEWFSILDQPPAERQRHLPDYLAQLPYVNGGLVYGVYSLPPAAFATELSQLELLFAAYRTWQAPLLPPPAMARRKTKT